MGCLCCTLPVKMILASDNTLVLFAICLWLANYACESCYNKSFFWKQLHNFLKLMV